MKKKILAWILSAAVVLTPLASSNISAAMYGGADGVTDSQTVDGYEADGFFGEDESLFENPGEEAPTGEDAIDESFRSDAEEPDGFEGEPEGYEDPEISDEAPGAEGSEAPDPENDDESSLETEAPGYEDPDVPAAPADEAPGREGDSEEEDPASESDDSDVSVPEEAGDAEPEKLSGNSEDEPVIEEEEAETADSDEKNAGVTIAGLEENTKLYKPKNGIYVLDTSMDGTNLLSIKNSAPGADLAEGAKAVVTDNVKNLSAYWQLTKNEDDSYRIVSFESGYALTASGTEVIQKEYTGDDSQKWLIRRFGTKTYTSFTPKSNTKMRLALAGSTDKFAAGGSKIILAKAGATHQMWYVMSRPSPQVSLEDGDYQIYPHSKSAKAVYVNKNAKEEDAPVVLYSWLGRRGQWFHVKSLGRGNLYSITNIYSKKALYPFKGANTAGTEIVQHTVGDGLDQAWQLTADGESYKLIHVMSGLALGLDEDSYDNQTALTIEKPKDKKTQKWSFAPIDTVGKDTAGEDAKLASGYYRLTNAADTSLVASVSGSRTKVGTQLALLEKTAKERATFYIKSLGKGRYAIRSFFNMKYVGVNYDTAENNYKLETKADYSAASSKWYIRKSVSDSGKLSIVNAGNQALVLTCDGDAKSGAVLKISLSTGEKAQRWSSTKMINQKPLTDGQRYVLGSQLNTGLVISTENTLAGSGGAVLRSSEKQPWEVYIFEYVGPSNIYRIRNQWSGRVLAGASKSDGEKVSLVNESEAENQLWHVRAMGTAKYNIANVKTGNLLTVKGGSAASGTAVTVSEEKGNSSQLWVMHTASSLEKVPTQINVVISPKGTNNVVEVRDGSLVDRTPIQFNYPSGAAKQVFQILPSGNYYKIRNVATGRYLTSSSGKITSRTSISGKAQLWKVFPSGIRYYFKNVGNGKYLSTNDPVFSPGTQLIISATKMVSRLTYTTVTGWQYVTGGMKYFKEDGSVEKNSFLNYNGNLVYVGNDGLVQTGWFKYGSYYYYFNGTAGQVKSDARPYIGKLYPSRRGGFYKDEKSGPACSYRITVDRQHPCQVTVYTQYPGQTAFNVPVVSYLCSTGADGTPTAGGERVTIHSGRWQELMGPSWGQFGMAILLRDENNQWYVNGDFFHSLACPEPNDHNLDVGSYNVLGVRASHGCVRLNVRNAYWQYNFIPDNTGVYVGDNLARPLNALAQPYASGSSPIDPTDPNYTGNYGYTENGVYYNPVGFH